MGGDRSSDREREGRQGKVARPLNGNLVLIQPGLQLTYRTALSARPARGRGKPRQLRELSSPRSHSPTTNESSPPVWRNRLKTEKSPSSRGWRSWGSLSPH